MNQKMFNTKICFHTSIGSVTILPSPTSTHNDQSNNFTEFKVKQLSWTLPAHLEPYMDIPYCLTEFMHTGKRDGDTTIMFSIFQTDGAVASEITSA